MGSKNTEVKVSKQELERANNMWEIFTEATKWSIVATAGILILLAVVFL